MSRAQMLFDEMKSQIEDMKSSEDYTPGRNCRIEIKDLLAYFAYRDEEIRILLELYNNYTDTNEYVEVLETSYFQALIKVKEKEIIVLAMKHNIQGNESVRNCINAHAKTFPGPVGEEFDMDLQLAKLEAAQFVLDAARANLKTLSVEEAKQIEEEKQREIERSMMNISDRYSSLNASDLNRMIQRGTY